MPTQQSPIATTAEVRVETRGDVTLAAPEYARGKIRAVLDRLEEPVLAVRVKLTQEPNHAVARPSIAQATIDLNGRPVRAQVAAAGMAEAIDLLQDRLIARLARLRHGHGHVHGHGHGRRHEPTAPEHRPQRRVREPQDRAVVRHKAYSLARQTADAAVLELEAMDYDFHLFTDAVSGADSVVQRDPVTGGHLVRSAGPALSVAEAVSHLELSGRSFLLFTDTATERGNVLYHRYDGHYGLITPAQ